MVENIRYNDSTSFHLHLLSKVVDMDKYPLIKLIIDTGLSKDECNELLKLLHSLNIQYETQKEEGFLDYTSLLLHFVGMLNEKLEPAKTIYALKKEGYYPSLIREFVILIEKYD
ncbi:DUF1878 family protein [Virgibacillus byunsanensis]|uniref:DUF1878 family protein n=1 Tax=Virgibacillus byunsanensis TaxID=570945 RepID=A0ABW3LK51_9BACI